MKIYAFGVVNDCGNISIEIITLTSEQVKFLEWLREKDCFSEDCVFVSCDNPRMI